VWPAAVAATADDVVVVADATRAAAVTRGRSFETDRWEEIGARSR
jgi:hypothetical protein